MSAAVWAGLVAAMALSQPVHAQNWTYRGIDGQSLQVQRNGMGSGYVVTGPQGYQGTITRDTGMQSEDVQQLLRRR